MFPRKHIFKKLLLLVLAVPGLVLATPLYRMTLLPQDFNASRLNDAGHVVGTARGGAAIWSPTSTAYLASLLPGSEGLAINNRGAVAGLIGTNAFVIDSGAVSIFGEVSLETWATAINDAGQVAGFTNDIFSRIRAFTYAAGAFTDLGSFGGDISMANAINASGQAAGFSTRPGDGGDWADPERYASVYRDGAQHDLGSLGGRISEANDINDAGFVAGWSSLSDGITERPFLFAPDQGRMLDLGTLGGVVGRANALNSAGLVVGLSDIGGGSFDYHAFVYGAGVMADLNTLVAEQGDWVFVSAADINDVGHILAQACRGGLDDCRAVRLDLIAAVPEPGAWAMLATGLLMLLWRARWRLRRFARAPALLGALCVSSLATTASAAPASDDTQAGAARFRVTFLPDGFTAYAINSRGHVAGDNGAAAVWDGVTVRDYAALAPGSIARAINSLGQLGGGYNDSVHVFGPAGLHNLERSTLFSSSYAIGLNDSGGVIGNAYWGAGERVRGFAVTRGVTRPIPSLGGDFSFALAINRHGHVTGNAALESSSADPAYHAFLFRDRTMLDLGTLGGRDSAGFDINDAGQVAGYAETDTVDDAGNPLQVPFLYTSGVMRSLGTLGGNYGVANGLNNLGAVVGQSFLDNDALEPRAFLYEGGALRDLNQLSTLPAGWVLTSAGDINDARQILALACKLDVCRHVRLDPPPR